MNNCCGDLDGLAYVTSLCLTRTLLEAGLPTGLMPVFRLPDYPDVNFGVFTLQGQYLAPLRMKFAIEELTVKVHSRLCKLGYLGLQILARFLRKNVEFVCMSTTVLLL